MCTRLTRFAACLVATIPSLALLAGCGVFGEDEVTPYQEAKTEFDEALEAAVADEMVPSVPANYVVLGFSQADSGVYKTSYLEAEGSDETLELNHTATVCVGDDPESLEQECGSRTETKSFEIREFDGSYLLIFPEGALTEPVRVSDNSTSLILAFDQGWELWAPEN